MNGESQDQHAVIAGVFVSFQIQIHISVGLYVLRREGTRQLSPCEHRGEVAICSHARALTGHQPCSLILDFQSPAL